MPVAGPEGHPVDRLAPQDARPSFSVATFGLARRFRRLLEIIVRHARHNPYRYVLTGDAPSPAIGFDIALVDMTSQVGSDTARALRAHKPGRSVIGVGRRRHHARGSDDLLLRNFSLDVLGVLNRVAERLQNPGDQPGTGVDADRTALEQAIQALVVDPSPSWRSQAIVSLRQIGIRSVGADSLAAASLALARQDYSLVVTELDLPDGNGIELIRRLHAMERARRPHVLVSSKRSGWFDMARAALAGCEGFLEKPVEPSTLQASACRVLARGHRQIPPLPHATFPDRPSTSPRGGAVSSLVAGWRRLGMPRATQPAGSVRRSVAQADRQSA